MKKRMWIGIILLFVIVIAIFVERINSDNAERAVVIKENIMGNTFVGQGRDYKSVDEGGAVKLISFTDTEIECTISSNGKVTITYTISYFDGIGTMIDGKWTYDDVKTSVRDYEAGDVEVALFGSAKIQIGKKWYALITDENNHVDAIVVDGILCEIKES